MMVFPVACLLGLLPIVNASTDPASLASIRKVDSQTPVDVQVALALSAGPPIAAGATVYVVGPKGFVKQREGTNGFSCIVNRENGALAPECYDAEGTATVLKTRFFEEEQRAQGVAEAEIKKAVWAGYKAGRFHGPRKPGLVYMLSPYNYIFDTEKKQIVHFPGHLMFYAPYATSRDVGEGPDAPYVVDPGTPEALMIVLPVTKGSHHDQ
jgi:hypothetical protein